MLLPYVVVGLAAVSVPAWGDHVGEEALVGSVTEFRLDDPGLKHSVVHYRFLEAVPSAPGRAVRDLRLVFEGFAPKHLRSGDSVRIHGIVDGGDVIVHAQDDIERLSVSVAPAALTGTQRLLVMLVNFTDVSLQSSPAEVRSLLFGDPAASVDAYYREASFGAISLTGDVAGPFTIGFASASSDFYGWAFAADALAAQAGIDVGAYDHKVYVLPPNGTTYGGVGTMFGYPSQAWIFAERAPVVFAHELGHNLGMHHASSAPPVTPGVFEYGDTSDVMGTTPRLTHLNAPHKLGLGWIDPANVRVVTSSGTYLVALEEVQRPDTQVLEIGRPGDGGDPYYVSFRRPVGFDAWANPPATTWSNATSIHNWDGVSSDHTYLRQVLGDGQTFTDLANGITITQLSHDDTFATVEVQLGPLVPVPSVTLTAPTVAAKPGASIAYTVTIASPTSATAASLSLTASVPASWSAKFAPDALSLAPGMTATSTLTVAPPAGVADGLYAIEVTASDGHVSVSASAVFQVDGTPPTPPGDLHARAKKHRTKLTWADSTDDSGIATYNVLRDGALVGSTIDTIYLDLAVSPGPHTYEVQAVDGAGNVSSASIQVP
jgi:hypothetical protein